MPVEISAPPIVRQGHGLLSAATIDPAGATGDNHWWNGIAIAGAACGPGNVYPVCDTAQRADTTEAPSVTAQPFVVEGPAIECVSASASDLTARALAGLDAILQTRIEDEFWADTLGTNPNALTHMPVTGIIGGGAAYSPTTGLAALIGAAGSRQITIHAPSALAVAWTAEGLLSGGARLETIVGRHIVSAGDGYSGLPPASYVGIPNGIDETWVFATGAVKALVSEPLINDAFATPQNTKQVRAERVIGLIHDECIWFALKIDLCKGQAA